MQLADYLKDLAPIERRRFAKRVGTSVNYLWQIAGGIRSPKAQLAVEISRESGGLVHFRDLVPELDWAYVRRVCLAETRRAS